jgi:DNA-binding beta-propeller fold protein YncE
VVGNAPTADGTAATATAGSLLVINNQGKLIQTFKSAWIQGPWDMALVDGGDWAKAFVSNALTGTVIRMDFAVGANGLQLLSTKVIASGYVHRGDPVTLFVAPTGLVYNSRSDVLYVASTGDNTVFAVRHAAERTDDDGTGTIIYQDNVHLHGPLGMAQAPNGHLLVSNNDGINSDANQPSEIVEFTVEGQFVKQLSVDPAQGGAFGLAVRTNEDTAVFAAVDDNTATLLVWTLNLEH